MGLFSFFKKDKTVQQAATPQPEPIPQPSQEPQAPAAEEVNAEEVTPVAEVAPAGVQSRATESEAPEPVAEESAATEPAVPAPAPEPVRCEPELTPIPEPAPAPASTPTPVPAAPAVEAKQTKDLEAGLEKTRSGLFSKLARAVAGRSRVDESVLDDLEEVLITSDVGVETTVKIIRRLEERVARDKYMNAGELNAILREEVAALLQQNEIDAKYDTAAREGVPFVVMVVGVNGVGKTTTIGKLAAQLRGIGKKVYIGAADTFRAAAIDQLEVWAERAGATIVRQQMGSDPASVAFDTLKSAVANGADVVLIDTAGRLHNKVGLMNELTKIRNVMAKVIPDAPHEVMLVLDGSTGQNAFEQARQFTQATQVTSLAITKLDGTAKGGVVIGISDQFQIPVRYIGVGEGIDQLQIFDRKQFVDTLFS